MIPGLILLFLFMMKKMNSGTDDRGVHKKGNGKSNDENIDE